MSVNQVDKQTGDTSRIAGGTLYADAPIGAILAFGGSSAPAGWLLCQGQAVSRTTYAALFAVIGTAYGAGDGSTTFNIPDGREVTLKGAGESGYTVGAHVKAGGLAVGEFLDDRIQSHTHTYKRLTGPGSAIQDGGASFENHDNETSAPNSARTGATTEVKAIGVNYIIKAQQVALPADFATELDKKQNITDNTLQTDSKTVPGAINEIFSSLLKINVDTTTYTGLVVSTLGNIKIITGWIKVGSLPTLAANIRPRTYVGFVAVSANTAAFHNCYLTPNGDFNIAGSPMSGDQLMFTLAYA